MAQCCRNDLVKLKMERFVEDEKDRRLCEQVFRENFEVIRDIMYMLRSNSDVFPLITYDTIYDHFASKLLLAPDNWIMDKVTHHKVC